MCWCIDTQSTSLTVMAIGSVCSTTAGLRTYVLGVSLWLLSQLSPCTTVKLQTRLVDLREGHILAVSLTSTAAEFCPL